MNLETLITYKSINQVVYIELKASERNVVCTIYIDYYYSHKV